jgi:hypothetical protein
LEKCGIKNGCLLGWIAVSGFKKNNGSFGTELPNSLA